MLNKTIIFTIVKLSITMTVSIVSSNLQISQVNTNTFNPFHWFTTLPLRLCFHPWFCFGLQGVYRINRLKGSKVKKPQDKCCPFPPVAEGWLMGSKPFIRYLYKGEECIFLSFYRPKRIIFLENLGFPCPPLPHNINFRSCHK